MDSLLLTGSCSQEDKSLTFQVGDTIVYPSQGGGRINEITTREVLGETHKYLKLSFIRGDMDVFVPLNKSDEVNLRHAIKKDDIEKLFDIMLSPNMDLPIQWPPRHRFELEVLAEGEAFQLANLLGILTQRDLEKGLADTEREIMERSKNMLASEIAVVKDISFKDAAKEIKEKFSSIKH